MGSNKALDWIQYVTIEIPLFHWKTWNVMLLPNLGVCCLEEVTAFLWQRLERYIPLIFFLPYFTFTCVETHCFWKWRCSGVSCKICISLPQTSGYLLTGCEREREERLPVLEPVTLVKMQCHKHQAIILIDVQHII